MSQTQTATVARDGQTARGPAAAAAAAVPSRSAATTVPEQHTIIDGVCYDLTNFMDTHPGQEKEGEGHRCAAGG